MQRDRILQWLKSSSITSACDLDLLLFFTRHSGALLTADHIAAFVGYDTRVVTEAIERFVVAGMVSRLQVADRPVSLYVVAADDRRSEALFSLLDIASSRPGMLAVKDALSSRTSGGRASHGRSSSEVVSEKA